MVRRRRDGPRRRRRARRALAGGAAPSSSTTSCPDPRSPGSTPMPRRSTRASIGELRGADRRQSRHAGTRHTDAGQRRQPRPRRDRGRRRRYRRAGRRRAGGYGPTQSLADGGSAFRASVPGNGLAPAVPLAVDDHVVVTDRSMTNHHLAVRWDAAGNLTSIIDLGHAREIVPGPRRSRPCCSWRPTIPSSTTRGISKRGHRRTPRPSRRPTGSRSSMAARWSAP